MSPQASARALAAPLIFLAMLAPASPATGQDRFLEIPLHASRGCTAPMFASLPSAPRVATACDGPQVPFGVAHSAPAPCASVVPLVDDRCEGWTARFDGDTGQTDYPTGDLGGSRLLAASPEGSTVFAAGTTDADPSTAGGWAGLDMDLVVFATDAASGDRTWSVRLPGPGQSIAQHVVADPGGDLVYATSHDYDDVADCTRQPATVALSQATGSLAWVARESTPTNGCVDVQTAAVDPVGERLYLVATTEGGDGRSEQALIARDADTGELLWSASTPGTSSLGETGTAVAVSPDSSRVYVGGSALSDATGSVTHVAWTFRGYDATDGETRGTLVVERIWEAPLPTSPTPANPPAAMAVSPDGGTIYVAGGMEHVPGRFFDITVAAFDTTSGEERWRYRYDGPRNKSSFDSVWYNGPLALSADGTRIAVAGYSTHLVGVNLQFDLATAFLDTSDGRGLWVTRYTAENETNWIPSVAVSPDAATVYVAAPSRYAVKWEAPARYTTLAYDAATGESRWTARHSEGHSFAQGSVLTPGGKWFVVTGMTAETGTQTVTGVNWNIGLAAYATEPPAGG